MFKRIFVIFIFLFLTSCTFNDDNKRFKVLNEMFDIWLSKNIQNQEIYFFQNTNSKNNFLLDLERFKFELSQINKNKIYNSNKNQFRNMSYKIDKILISNKFINNNFCSFTFYFFSFLARDPYKFLLLFRLLMFLWSVKFYINNYSN